MKKLFSFIILLLFILNLSGQDTTIVQTLTYDSTGRSYVFDFPIDTGQSYEKILMLYSMRCKNALVSNGNDRNKGCGEWDYSCNTFVTDSTLTDSIKAKHPSHIIPGFRGNVFEYTTQDVFTFYQYRQYLTTNTNIISENQYQLGGGNDSLNYPFNFTAKASKNQYLFTSQELKDAGLTKGNISALSLNVLASPQKANFLRIGIKQLSVDSISETEPVLDDFAEVYFENTELQKGKNIFYFYNKFDWDGESNLLVEFSFTNNYTGENVKVEGTKYDKNITMLHKGDDYYLNFSGVGKLNFDNTDFSSISDEITISLWTYGNPDKMPTNSTIFEGVDNSNRRQVNCHLPWSNSRVYWDCGNTGNYDRIDKAAGIDELEGKWNYWTFVKNATKGLMKIYLNGNLWHSGTGKKNKIDLNTFCVGASNGNNYSYYGFADNLSIWNKALDEESIRQNMFNSPDQTNIEFNNLIGSYDFNEKEGNLFNDKSQQSSMAVHNGVVSHKFFRGKDIFKGFTHSKFRPNITFYQGEYEQNNVEKIVLDSVKKDINKIYYYQLSGTDIVLSDSLNAFQAGYSYVYDSKSSELIDSVYYAPENTINITELKYYKKYPSKFELMSFVTPYGIGLNLGVKGKTWQFDVTDFKPVLTGKKRLSVEFGKYQEELDIKFLFIEGTPPRNVNRIQQLWRPGIGRGYKSLLDNSFFEPRDVVLDDNSTMFKIRAAITGHGQEGEFIGRNHYINLNGGSKEFNWRVWKECADNPIYPQGGTWIYDRAGWCPGAPTNLKEMEITDMVNPGETVNFDYGVQTASGDSRYIVNCQLVSYGAPNFAYDVAIESIQRPSNRVEFSRFNPICYNPEVVIQNRGSEVLKEAIITYYVKGGEKSTYKWTGSLSFLEKEKVALPIENTSFWLGDGSNFFVAEVDLVDKSLDQYTLNNRIVSSFKLPDILKSEFTVVYRTNKRPSENKLYIRDMKGNIIYQKNITSSNSLYKKDLLLGQGCYELELTDSGEDGLSFWANPNQGNGYLYLKRKNIRLKTINPDFGKFVRYQFLVGGISKVDNQIISDDVFDIYPNPVSGHARLKFNIVLLQDSKLEITDITGKKMEQLSNLSNREFSFDFSNYKSGLYIVKFIQNGKTYIKKLIVE